MALVSSYKIFDRVVRTSTPHEALARAECATVDSYLRYLRQLFISEMQFRNDSSHMAYVQVYERKVS